MLSGQDGGRNRNSDLFSRQRDSRRRPQGDLGLAEADITADHPVHRVTSRQIVQHVPDRLGLINRRELGKARDEPFIGRPRSDQLGSTPAPSLGDMFRKLLGRCFDFLLGLATSVPPRAAIGLV